MMKLVLFTVLLLNSYFCSAQQNQREVMILGTVHFDEKISSEQKQEELNSLLSKLEKFKPDQIFIEQSSDSDSLWHKIYRSYSVYQEAPRNPYLKNNEIFQVGVKLANRLNLNNGVQGIDWPDPDTNDLSKAPSDPIKLSYYNYVKDLRALSVAREESIHDIEGFVLYEEYLQKLRPIIHLNDTLSLEDHLLALNDPETIKNLYLILRTGEMLINLSDIGAELSSIAVKRDYKIFRNALTKVDDDTEKILIIYGAGHSFMLRQLYDLHPGYNIIEPSEYLE
ncbi:DUF5694 domain-containing protein [Litoribacter populi]|uniref:DUF5694 domain-containing protein n=1 Tax=Litoribacter populi TaxID=2598460 RepID=UPI0011803092|nr:DUF5694 domain-containing protein [Litoribacter populi]